MGVSGYKGIKYLTQNTLYCTKTAYNTLTNLKELEKGFKIFGKKVSNYGKSFYYGDGNKREEMIADWIVPGLMFQGAKKLSSISKITKTATVKTKNASNIIKIENTLNESKNISRLQVCRNGGANVKKVCPIGDPGAKCVRKVPKNWVFKTANNSKGTKYANPKRPDFDHIRFMRENMDPRAPIGQQKPYFIRSLNGKNLTKDGKWVISDKTNRDLYHIPQEMFDKLLPFMKFD